MAHEILLPALSPTMTTGNLTRWLKKEGDRIEIGDVIAEIETDKAVMEVEALDEGILGKILVAAGTEDIAIKTPIAIVIEEGEEVPAQASASTEKSSAPAEKPVEAEKTKEVPAKAAQTAPEKEEESSQKRVFASPLARRIAKEKDVALATINGTGPNGRIVRRDVETHLKSSEVQAPKAMPQKVQAPAASEKAEDSMVPHSLMRKVIARRMVASKQDAPHFYVFADVKLDKLLALRKELNHLGDEEGFKISVNDMIIKAAALALKKEPGMNVIFEENHMRRLANIDISVVVSVPDGLITPIVRKADTKSLRQISAEVKDLVARARISKLAFEEYQGGSFSISNLGMFGVKKFTSIINPPQAAIMAVGAGQKQPVVKEDGQLGVATVMSVSIAVDHRAVDGATAAQWLNAFKNFLENPHSLVL
ncbi:pyruvate dehydrogenase complex dihydrolipoamide acetyltransferase [Acetobacteraceae bacterium]|nr:pyruvate dehydrogenase complex dihydrolipoamide acetyltransferase [Acetobacteraceae bacterium]